MFCCYGNNNAWKWSATVVRHFLRVFECGRLKSWPHEMFNVQLIPTLVASSTVHSDNLEPGFKLSYEIGVSGASSLADILRVQQTLNKLSIHPQTCSQGCKMSDVISCWFGYDINYITVHPRIFRSRLSSLIPRLFLVEERAWQHWGVGAVYFRYVMVHVIYSDPALFLKIIMWFLWGHVN